MNATKLIAEPCMKLARRIAQLEVAQPRPRGKCPRCGRIDPTTASGPFFGGITMPLEQGNENGRWWCLCKTCGRRFTCEVQPHDVGGAVGDAGEVGSTV